MINFASSVKIVKKKNHSFIYSFIYLEVLLAPLSLVVPLCLDVQVVQEVLWILSLLEDQVVQEVLRIGPKVIVKIAKNAG